MSNTKLKKLNTWNPELQRTVLLGFVLRLLMLIVIVYLVNDVWDIFYIEDDKKYEELAAVYRANASGILDLDLFNKITVGYAQTFWPFVMCVSTKLFGTLYAGRYINIVLSSLCIPVVYKLTRLLSDNEKVAMMAAKLFAFMPITILTACFPIKDIFITLGVLYAFCIFVALQSGLKVSIGQVVVCATLMICVYFSRGAVTEMMLLFLIVYYLQKLFREKKYVAALFVLMGAVALFILFHDAIMGAFSTKVEDYGGYAADEAVGLNAIRVTSAADLYKLPLAYAFAMLQPLKLNLLAVAEDTRQWRTVMSYANMTAYPVAVCGFLYLFSKKHNLFFWLSSFVMYAAVIMLSLGVSRHYLFMMPITFINCALYLDEDMGNIKNRRTLVIVGTFAVFMLIFCYSLVKVM